MRLHDGCIRQILQVVMCNRDAGSLQRSRTGLISPHVVETWKQEKWKALYICHPDDALLKILHCLHLLIYASVCRVRKGAKR